MFGTGPGTPVLYHVGFVVSLRDALDLTFCRKINELRIEIVDLTWQLPVSNVGTIVSWMVF